VKEISCVIRMYEVIFAWILPFIISDSY
jgi:hypothetical protein